MTILKEKVIDTIVQGLSNENPDNLEVDNDGMIIIYTDIYRWSDGSYHDSKEE